MRLQPLNLSRTVLLSAALLFGWVSQTQASIVLDFDDIAPSGNGQLVNHQGFRFSAAPLHWIDVSDGSGFPYGTTSGNFAAANISGGTVNIAAENGSEFTFDGLWMKKWGTAAAPSLPGGIYGYKDGSLEWVIDTNLNGTYQGYGVSEMDVQTTAIDRLSLVMQSPSAIFLVDDIALTAVPEPTAFLAWAGIATTGLVMRRRRR